MPRKEDQFFFFLFCYTLISTLKSFFFHILSILYPN